MSVFANNRFLKRVNPEIVRAKDDSGSSLNHPEIQKLMRQMVDMDIADNLKLWVHNGLVKTRTSGSDLFVPKAYDISGEENDAAQATEANQPKLVSDGMEFDGSDDYLSIPHDNSLNHGSGSFSIGFWVNINPLISATSIGLVSKYPVGTTEGPHYGFEYNDGAFRFGVRDDNGNTNRNTMIYTLTEVGWCYVFGVRSGDIFYLYINGGIEVTDTDSTIGNADNTSNFNIGRVWTSDSVGGIINDIRIFNKALSATEISAIYNTTAPYYGITP